MASPKSDWLWPNVADENGFCYVDIFASVFVGRKEIQPEFDNWSKPITSILWFQS
jgi:hypothetical protein